MCFPNSFLVLFKAYFTRSNLCDGEGDRVSKLGICVMEEETEFLNNFCDGGDRVAK